MAYAISHCDSSTLLSSSPFFSILSISIPVAKFSHINFYGILRCQMTQENNFLSDRSFIFPLGFTPLEYQPYLAGPFDWPRSRRYLEEAFWKRVPELQSFGHAHSFQRTIDVIEYSEKLTFLTIQDGNNIVMQNNSLHCQYDMLFLLEHQRYYSIKVSF